MEKKNFVKSTVQEVYAHPGDKELGIPPLFSAQVEIFDVDFARIEEVPSVQLNYKRKED